MLKALFKRFRSNPIPAEPAAAGKAKGWIGVDLDGTLAYYDGWMGHFHIGEPIAPMLERVQKWLSNGQEVRILTARASVPEHKKFVELWLQQHGLGELQVTHSKDYGMIELWDDRCIQVAVNTGQPVSETLHAGR
ncbi:MAG: hypothetical protein JKX83_07745 [Pseudomonadales bacterium]|nr:hypothetical protein [Pseudomonadales bacterium]